MANDDPKSSTSRVPKWVWVPALCLCSIVILFLITSFFITPTLTNDQRNVIRLLFSLASGFATMFFGGSCLLEFDIPKNNGGKLALSATGGVAVFIFTYMSPPYWHSPSPEPIPNPVVQNVVFRSDIESKPSIEIYYDFGSLRSTYRRLVDFAANADFKGDSALTEELGRDKTKGSVILQTDHELGDVGYVRLRVLDDANNMLADTGATKWSVKK